MEEQYKDATIVITAAPSVIGLKWRSSCAVKFLKDERETVEYLELIWITIPLSKRNALAWYSQKYGLMPGNLSL